MLFAVHLSDGVVTGAWAAGGWAVAAALLAFGGRRLTEDEIPRLGVLTAAFFVASQVHLPAGGVSVHLLLNGLLGVVLGGRAVLAVAVGLTLQALLLGHGGLVQTLGLNIAHYALPAVLAGAAFPPLLRSRVLHQPAPRFLAVTLVGWGWLLTAAVAVQTSWVKLGRGDWPDGWAGWWAADPILAGGLLAVAAGFALFERRLEADPAFPVGLLLGALTAWATVGLTVLSLRFGGTATVADKAELVLLLHVPVVAVEAVGVGFVVAYLNRAKPEWLAGGQPAGSGNTSANGTSH